MKARDVASLRITVATPLMSLASQCKSTSCPCAECHGKSVRKIHAKSVALWRTESLYEAMNERYYGSGLIIPGGEVESRATFMLVLKDGTSINSRLWRLRSVHSWDERVR